MRVATNAQLDEWEAEKAPPKKRIPQTVVDELAAHVQTCWQAALTHKEDKLDERLLNCLRRRDGKYDYQKVKELEKLGTALVYFRHTSLKCRAAKAWIKDVLIPADDRPWGLDPTPIPDLPPELRQIVVERTMTKAIQTIQTTGQMPTEDDVRSSASDMADIAKEGLVMEARRRAARMEDQIEDQFVEGGFRDAFMEVLDDVTTFPSGILKGPVIETKRQLAYSADGSFTPVVTEEQTPTYKRVSPFDFYPSPQSSGVDDGFLIERMRLYKNELARFRDVPGYDKKAIDTVLEEHSSQSDSNDTVATDWERAELESKELNGAQGTEDGRIEIFEYWGTVEGSMLKKWGLPGVDDPQKQYDVTVMVSGNTVLRALLNPDPLGRRPYYVASYETVPGSIWGISIPEIMEPLQDVMNSMLRSMVDNVGFASGPQIGVDVDRMHPSMDVTKVYPRKMWFFENNPLGSQLPIQFFQPNMNLDPLIRGLAKFETLADDYTGIPRYAYGNEDVGGAGETASGLSMLMNAASKGIRQVIGNISEGILSQIVERQFTWNMLYLDDRAIKGDCKVNARGALAVVLREQLQVQRRMFADATNNPTDIQITGLEGRRKLLQSLAADLELPGVVPREEAFARQQQAQAQMAMQQQQQQLAAEAAGEEKKQLSAMTPTAPKQRVAGPRDRL